MIPTHAVHKAIGMPQPQKAKGLREMHPEEFCLVCGQTYPECVPANVAIPSTDTDRDRFIAPWSDVVCTACVWCSEGRPPDTIRMWSILYREDGDLENPGLFREYITAKQKEKGTSYGVSALLGCEDVLALVNKANLSSIVRTLVNPPQSPWAACLADSGQIHLLRFARMNVGRQWTILLEREEIEGDSDTFSRVLWHVASLRQAGFHTNDIETLSPHPRSLREAPLAWMTHARKVLRERPDLRDLALFLCTKDFTDEYRSLSEEAVGPDYRNDSLKRGEQALAGLPGLHTAREKGPEKVLEVGPESDRIGVTQGTLF